MNNIIPLLVPFALCRRPFSYASFLGIEDALYLEIFQQPSPNGGRITEGSRIRVKCSKNAAAFPSQNFQDRIFLFAPLLAGQIKTLLCALCASVVKVLFGQETVPLGFQGHLHHRAAAQLAPGLAQPNVAFHEIVRDIVLCLLRFAFQGQRLGGAGGDT